MLVEIHMPNSRVKRLWDGVQDVVNLKMLDLAGSEQLMELPDLSEAHHLETVILDNCTQLCHVHPSILRLQKLVTLRLGACLQLRSLKSEIHLTSLRYLNVDGCWNLKEFAMSCTVLEELDLTETGIEILHSSIGLMSKLQYFIVNGRRLRNLPNELCWLRSLSFLMLSNCGDVDKAKLHILFDGLRWSFLRTLFLNDCCNLSELPDNIKVLSWLNSLGLDGSSVERLPASIKHLPRLKFLYLHSCRSLESLPELPPSVEHLDASDCTSLVTVTAFKGYISCVKFLNCLKLNEESIHNILESTHFRMMREGEISYPGGRVPERVPYRTREANSIFINTIELLRPFDPLLGFVVYAVLPPVSKRGYTTFYCNEQLYSSHVFIRFVPFDRKFKERIGLGDDDQYCTSYNPKVVPLTFELNGFRRATVDDDSLKYLEELGVCPLYASQTSVY